MTRLRDRIELCRRCELAGGCTAPVAYSGRPSPVAVVGEAPGAREDLVGRPFVGPAGRLLWNNLARYGMERSEVFVCNAVCCFPKGTPTRAHIEACRPNLLAQLRYCRPDFVLALGSVANASLKWPERVSITKIRGVFEYDAALDAHVFSALHPAAILRNPLYAKVWRADLRRFVERVREDVGRGVGSG